MKLPPLAQLVPAGGMLPLADFVSGYMVIKPGQHVTLIGPNGCGKTTIGMKILAQATQENPGTRGLMLVMKPDRGPKSEGRKATGDRTVSRLARQLGFRVTRNWPPMRLPFRGEPPAWVYWPRHTMDPDIDEDEHYARFRAAILDSYRSGDTWVMGDEAYGLSKTLGLDRELVTLLSQGRSMNAGAILATQRPAWVPPSMYSEAKHLFLWRMADGAIYDRLREIGGQLDPRRVEAILRQLPDKHSCLYLQPEDDLLAVLT